MGKLVQFWSLAQKHWGNEKELVPEHEFAQGDWEILLDVGLAERRPTGIYARGAEKRFKWYLDLCRNSRKIAAARRERAEQRLDSAGDPDGSPDGHPSGLIKREKHAQERKDRVHTDSTRTPDGDPIGGPSLLLTPSSSLSKTPLVADVSDDEAKRLPVRTLAKLWNELKHPTMPVVDVAKLSSASPRYRFARQRLVENPDLAYWRSVIERIAKSRFCRGENPRGWTADFAFLVRAETHVKAMEGKYDDRPDPKATPREQPLSLEQLEAMS